MRPVLDLFSFFFFNDTATTEIYTLSLHDALPISEPNLRIKQAEVVDLWLEDRSAGVPPASGPVSGELPKRRVRSIRLRDGRTVEAGAVVITTGTFLNGLIHCGEQTYPAGRSGEPPAAVVRAIAPRSKTRSSSLRTSRSTKSSSSPRAWTLTKST